MKFIRYALAIALVSTGLLWALYALYNRGYRHHYAHEIALMNERLNGREPYDILFLGSSRTAHQVNPEIVDSLLGLSSFNAGLDGIKVCEMNMILESYLQSHKQPSMVVMDLPPASFNSGLFPYYNQTLYYPFLDNKVVFDHLKTVRPVGLFRVLPFFQLTECNDEMRQRAMVGLFGSRYSQPGEYKKGFSPPPTDTLRLPFSPQPGVHAPITEKGLNYLKRTVQICRERNLPLMIIYPPAYRSHDLELNPEFYKRAKEICDAGGVVVKDYRGIYLKDDHRFFRDQTHLNQAGSNIFSAMVAADVQAELRRLQAVATR